jgi:hypothetical protein
MTIISKEKYWRYFKIFERGFSVHWRVANAVNEKFIEYYCSGRFKAIRLRFQQKIYACFAVAAIYILGRRKKTFTFLYDNSVATKIISSISHSLPQPAFHKRPE